jgi:hypothetical protein
MSRLTCDVCGKKVEAQHEIMTAASQLVPMTFGYCRPCAQSSLEPYVALVGGIVGVARDSVDPWLWDNIVKPSLAFHGVTEEQFWEEVDNVGRDYTEELSKGRAAVERGDNPPPFDPQTLDV